MKAIVAAVMLFACACSGGLTTGGPAARISPSTSPTPTAAAKSTPSIEAFKCRLPVTPWSSTQARAGFITFPAGSFVADATSGQTPGYYDLAVKAWLPVGRAAVAPDGRHYATTTEGAVDKSGVVLSPPTLHIVDALSRQQRILPLVGLQPAPATTALFPQVADYEANVIYLIEYGQAGSGELYAVDTSTGNVTHLTEAPQPEDVESGGFWYGNSPNVQGLGAPPGALVRWDLRTQTSSVWFKRSTGGVILLGLDRDRSAIVRWTTINPDGSIATAQIWSVSSPGHERLLYSGSSQPTAPAPLPAASGDMIADAHGLWIGSDSGVFLLSSTGMMQKMSDYAGAPANGCF